MSQLTLESLKGMGAFTGAPVEREITWKQGKEELTATVYVRPLSYLSAKSELLAMGGKGDAVAGRIAGSICDSEGNPVFTTEDITQGAAAEVDPETGEVLSRLGPLDGNLTMALLQVIGEVNGMGKQKSRRPKKKSGTS